MFPGALTVSVLCNLAAGKSVALKRLGYYPAMLRMVRDCHTTVHYSQIQHACMCFLGQRRQAQESRWGTQRCRKRCIVCWGRLHPDATIHLGAKLEAGATSATEAVVRWRGASAWAWAPGGLSSGYMGVSSVRGSPLASRPLTMHTLPSYTRIACS